MVSVTYFNPRTLQESATIPVQTSSAIKAFQSTHPTRECDAKELLLKQLQNEISIHAPYKRVRLANICLYCSSPRISIHAPYKRVRRGWLTLVLQTFLISIHAPYKRVRRQITGITTQSKELFQSTHPTRECDSR